MCRGWVRQTKSKPLRPLTKPHTDATFPSKRTLPTQLVPVKKKMRTIDGGPLFSRNLNGSRRARLRGRDAGRNIAGLAKFLRQRCAPHGSAILWLSAPLQLEAESHPLCKNQSDRQDRLWHK